MSELINFRRSILDRLGPDLQRIRVTVIDTGVDGTHPYIRHYHKKRSNEFNPEIGRSPHTTGEQNSDPSPPRDLPFRDFVDPGSNEHIDEDGHGTFIVGVILQLAPDVELSVARIGRTRSSMESDSAIHVKIKDVSYNTGKSWAYLTSSQGY